MSRSMRTLEERPRIPCSRCGGSGTMDLPYQAWETLRALGSPMTCRKLQASLSPVAFTALLNRLAQLEEWGLVTKEEGRPHIWRRKP